MGMIDGWKKIRTMNALIQLRPHHLTMLIVPVAGADDERMREHFIATKLPARWPVARGRRYAYSPKPICHHECSRNNGKGVVPQHEEPLPS